MSDPGELEELVAYLVRSSRLSAEEARRIVEDVLAFLHETPEQFVRRRHLALQTEGRSNTEIYLRLTAEVAARRFGAPAYTARQIRRMIYG
jgi:polyhydroxyalkanoate synthesis regulator phasin